MKILTAIVSFFLAVVFIACRSPADFTKKDQQQVMIEVRKVLNNYYTDINAAGLLAELKYLDSSENFFWTPPGYTEAITYDSVSRFVRQNAGNFRSIKNTWDTLRIIPLTKELASYTGKLHSAMTDTSGKTSTYVLIETGLMIKRDNGWKLLNGQTALLAE